MLVLQLMVLQAWTCYYLWWLSVLKKHYNRIMKVKQVLHSKRFINICVDLEPLGAAAIAVKLTFDKVFSSPRGR